MGKYFICFLLLLRALLFDIDKIYCDSNAHKVLNGTSDISITSVGDNENHPISVKKVQQPKNIKPDSVNVVNENSSNKNRELDTGNFPERLSDSNSEKKRTFRVPKSLIKKQRDKPVIEKNSRSVLFDVHRVDNLPIDCNYKNKSYSVYIVNPKTNTIRLFNKRADGDMYDFSSIKKDLEVDNKILLFAMNAGMYDNNRYPIGLYVDSGREWQPINLNNKSNQPSNFYDLSPNGIFVINKSNKAFVVDSKKYLSLIKNGDVKIATQSGPLLVINGKINSHFTEGSNNLNIRNGVGVNSRGNIAFVISNNPVNFYDISQFFRDVLRCDNALYFDGVVSKMYLPKLGKTDLTSSSHLGPIITVVK